MEEEQPISRQAAFLKAHALWLQAATTAAMEYMQTHPGTRWEAAMKAVAPDLWPEPLYEDYVKPKGPTKPPIRPAHIADKPTGGWSSWIGLGIVAAALTCIIVAMAVGPYLPQKISSPDSGQVQTPSVPRTDNPPYEIPAVPVKPPPATTSDNPYQDHPSPKPAEETPSSANKFHKPFVYPPRSEIGGERKVQPDAPFPPRYSRPPLSPTGQPWPSSSEYLLKQPEDGNSEVTIDNMQTGSDMLVELFDLSNRPPTAVRVVFLRAREQFHMNGARSGSYDIRYMNLDTGVIRKSEPLRLTERKLEHDVPKANGTEHITDIEGTEFSLTLYTVPMGNTHSQVINREEFDSTFLPRLGR